MALSQLNTGVAELDFDQLKDYLSMMSPQQRQQVAAQYKNSPYASIIIPMAMGISQEEQQKAQAMQAQQQQQGAQPQAKVVDQAIAQMAPQQQLPENQGIAQLPAQNIAQMADGGIAGYADSGPPQDIYSGDAEYGGPGMAAGGAVERYNGEFGSFTSPYGMSEEALAMDELRRKTLLEQRKFAEDKQRYEFLKGAAPDAAARMLAENPALEGAATPATTARPTAAPGATTTPAAPATGAPKPSATAATTPPTSTAPAGPRLSATAPTVEQAKKLAKEFSSRGDVAQGSEELVNLVTAETARQRAALEEGKPKGRAYEGLEAALKKEAEEAKGGRDEAKSMAFIEAGLQMMAGTSPNAFQNIAKGALAGVGGYKEAIKDFKKAERERTKAMADIEQARRAEDREDYKTKAAFEDRAAGRLVDAKQFGIKALVEAGVSDNKTAASLYERMLAEAGATERTRAQVAAANRTPAEMQIIERIMAEKKIPFSEALAFVSGTKREPMSMDALRKMWATDPTIRLQYPKFDDFAKLLLPSAAVGGGPKLSSADQALLDKYAPK